MSEQEQPTAELLRQFAERRDRMLMRASTKPIVYVAIGILVFNLWDRWLDPTAAGDALNWRVGTVLLLLPLFLVQRGGLRSVPASRWLHAAFFLIAMGGVAAATVQVDAGLVWGAPGIVIFQIMLAVYTLPLRWMTWLSAAGLALVSAIAFGFEVPSQQLLNFLTMYALAFIVSHFTARILFRQQLRLFMLERHHAEEARTDALTGLLNRRMLEELGHRQVDASHRLQRPLSTLMLDIDHFKRINDQFGHDVGDKALIAVARALLGAVREIDVLGRWGGEEFMALLLDADGRPALDAANRCIEAVRASQFRHQGRRIPLDISVGVSELRDGDSLESLLRRADQALYAAKAAGRGRAVVA